MGSEFWAPFESFSFKELNLSLVLKQKPVTFLISILSLYLNHATQRNKCPPLICIYVVLNVFLHRINESYLIWLTQWDLIQLPGPNVSPSLMGLLKSVNKAFRHDQCSINQQCWSANIPTVLILFVELNVSKDLAGINLKKRLRTGRKCTYLKSGIGPMINISGIGQKSLSSTKHK